MNFDVNHMLKRKLNVGKKDQQIRLGAGVAVLVLAWMLDSILFILLGLLLIVTSNLRWCPAYSAIGKSTVESGDEPPAVSK
jgi:hypothetical protein